MRFFKSHFVQLRRVFATVLRFSNRDLLVLKRSAENSIPLPLFSLRPILKRSIHAVTAFAVFFSTTSPCFAFIDFPSLPPQTAPGLVPAALSYQVEVMAPEVLVPATPAAALKLKISRKSALDYQERFVDWAPSAEMEGNTDHIIRLPHLGELEMHKDGRLKLTSTFQESATNLELNNTQNSKISFEGHNLSLKNMILKGKCEALFYGQGSFGEFRGEGIYATIVRDSTYHVKKVQLDLLSVLGKMIVDGQGDLLSPQLNLRNLSSVNIQSNYPLYIKSDLVASSQLQAPALYMDGFKAFKSSRSLDVSGPISLKNGKSLLNSGKIRADGKLTVSTEFFNSTGEMGGAQGTDIQFNRWGGDLGILGNGGETTVSWGTLDPQKITPQAPVPTPSATAPSLIPAAPPTLTPWTIQGDEVTVKDHPGLSNGSLNGPMGSGLIKALKEVRLNLMDFDASFIKIVTPELMGRIKDLFKDGPETLSGIDKVRLRLESGGTLTHDLKDIKHFDITSSKTAKSPLTLSMKNFQIQEFFKAHSGTDLLMGPATGAPRGTYSFPRTSLKGVKGHIKNVMLDLKDATQADFTQGLTFGELVEDGSWDLNLFFYYSWDKNSTIRKYPFKILKHRSDGTCISNRTLLRVNAPAFNWEGLTYKSDGISHFKHDHWNLKSVQAVFEGHTVVESAQADFGLNVLDLVQFHDQNKNLFGGGQGDMKAEFYVPTSARSSVYFNGSSDIKIANGTLRASDLYVRGKPEWIKNVRPVKGIQMVYHATPNFHTLSGRDDYNLGASIIGFNSFNHGEFGGGIIGRKGLIFFILAPQARQKLDAYASLASKNKLYHNSNELHRMFWAFQGQSNANSKYTTDGSAMAFATNLFTKPYYCNLITPSDNGCATLNFDLPPALREANWAPHVELGSDVVLRQDLSETTQILKIPTGVEEKEEKDAPQPSPSPAGDPSLDPQNLDEAGIQALPAKPLELSLGASHNYALVTTGKMEGWYGDLTIPRPGRELQAYEKFGKNRDLSGTFFRQVPAYSKMDETGNAPSLFYSEFSEDVKREPLPPILLLGADKTYTVYTGTARLLLDRYLEEDALPKLLMENLGRMTLNASLSRAPDLHYYLRSSALVFYNLYENYLKVYKEGADVTKGLVAHLKNLLDTFEHPFLYYKEESQIVSVAGQPDREETFLVPHVAFSKNTERLRTDGPGFYATDLKMYPLAEGARLINEGTLSGFDRLHINIAKNGLYQDSKSYFYLPHLGGVNSLIAQSIANSGGKVVGNFAVGPGGNTRGGNVVIDGEGRYESSLGHLDAKNLLLVANTTSTGVIEVSNVFILKALEYQLIRKQHTWQTTHFEGETKKRSKRRHFLNAAVHTYSEFSNGKKSSGGWVTVTHSESLPDELSGRATVGHAVTGPAAQKYLELFPELQGLENQHPAFIFLKGATLQANSQEGFNMLTDKMLVEPVYDVTYIPYSVSDRKRSAQGALRAHIGIQSTVISLTGPNIFHATETMTLVAPVIQAYLDNIFTSKGIFSATASVMTDDILPTIQKFGHGSTVTTGTTQHAVLPIFVSETARNMIGSTHSPTYTQAIQMMGVQNILLGHGQRHEALKLQTIYHTKGSGRHKWSYSKVNVETGSEQIVSPSFIATHVQKYALPDGSVIEMPAFNYFYAPEGDIALQAPSLRGDTVLHAPQGSASIQEVHARSWTNTTIKKIALSAPLLDMAGALGKGDVGGAFKTLLNSFGVLEKFKALAKSKDAGDLGMNVPTAAWGAYEFLKELKQAGGLGNFIMGKLLSVSIGVSRTKTSEELKISKGGTLEDGSLALIAGNGDAWLENFSGVLKNLFLKGKNVRLESGTNSFRSTSKTNGASVGVSYAPGSGPSVSVTVSKDKSKATADFHTQGILKVLGVTEIQADANYYTRMFYETAIHMVRAENWFIQSPQDTTTSSTSSSSMGVSYGMGGPSASYSSSSSQSNSVRTNLVAGVKVTDQALHLVSGTIINKAGKVELPKAKNLTHEAFDAVENKDYKFHAFAPSDGSLAGVLGLSRTAAFKMLLEAKEDPALMALSFPEIQLLLKSDHTHPLYGHIDPALWSLLQNSSAQEDVIKLKSLLFQTGTLYEAYINYLSQKNEPFTYLANTDGENTAAVAAYDALEEEFLSKLQVVQEDLEKRALLSDSLRSKINRIKNADKLSQLPKPGEEDLSLLALSKVLLENTDNAIGVLPSIIEYDTYRDTVFVPKAKKILEDLVTHQQKSELLATQVTGVVDILAHKMKRNLFIWQAGESDDSLRLVHRYRADPTENPKQKTRHLYHTNSDLEKGETLSAKMPLLIQVAGKIIEDATGKPLVRSGLSLLNTFQVLSESPTLTTAQKVVYEDNQDKETSKKVELKLSGLSLKPDRQDPKGGQDAGAAPGKQLTGFASFEFKSSKTKEAVHAVQTGLEDSEATEVKGAPQTDPAAQRETISKSKHHIGIAAPINPPSWKEMKEDMEGGLKILTNLPKEIAALPEALREAFGKFFEDNSPQGQIKKSLMAKGLKEEDINTLLENKAYADLLQQLDSLDGIEEREENERLTKQEEDLESYKKTGQLRISAFYKEKPLERILGLGIQGAQALGEIAEEHPLLVETASLGIQVAMGGLGRTVFEKAAEQFFGDFIGEAREKIVNKIASATGSDPESIKIYAASADFLLSTFLGKGGKDIVKSAKKVEEVVAKKLKGMHHPKVQEARAIGMKAHQEFFVKAKKFGWEPNATIISVNGKKLRPDALTRKGQPIELKPNTPSGRRQGARQIKEYEDALGKKGRVIYYDPEKYR